MSQNFEDVSLFARSITRNHSCIPCLVSKMKNAHIDLVDIGKSFSYSEFNYDLSGPVEPSLDGNE